MDETEKPDEKAFERFQRLAKKVVSVPKSKIGKRAKERKKARDGPRCVTALAGAVGPRNRGHG
jgi:hypothetical protein